jgi:hypothetical protein
LLPVRQPHGWLAVLERKDNATMANNHGDVEKRL